MGTRSHTSAGTYTRACARPLACACSRRTPHAVGSVLWVLGAWLMERTGDRGPNRDPRATPRLNTPVFAPARQRGPACWATSSPKPDSYRSLRACPGPSGAPGAPSNWA
eukprot:15440699-Alexandrium_andersonii.AAC.1